MSAADDPKPFDKAINEALRSLREPASLGAMKSCALTLANKESISASQAAERMNAMAQEGLSLAAIQSACGCARGAR